MDENMNVVDSSPCFSTSNSLSLNPGFSLDPSQILIFGTNPSGSTLYLSFHQAYHEESEPVKRVFRVKRTCCCKALERLEIRTKLCRSCRTMKSTVLRKKNKFPPALQTAHHIMVQYEGRMLVKALVTACTVPKPTSAASAALCSFAAIRLKIMWLISDCVIGLLLGLQPSLYGTLSSS